MFPPQELFSQRIRGLSRLCGGLERAGHNAAVKRKDHLAVALSVNTKEADVAASCVQLRWQKITWSSRRSGRALERRVPIGPERAGAEPRVFLDLGLPDMSGLDVAVQLSTQPNVPRPVLVALTGYGQPGDREQTCEAGFDHHLVKPAPIEDILHLLEDFGKMRRRN